MTATPLRFGKSKKKTATTINVIKQFAQIYSLELTLKVTKVRLQNLTFLDQAFKKAKKVK